MLPWKRLQKDIHSTMKEFNDAAIRAEAIPINLTLKSGRNKSVGGHGNRLTVSLVDKTAPFDPGSFQVAQAAFEKWLAWAHHVHDFDQGPA